LTVVFGRKPPERGTATPTRKATGLLKEASVDIDHTTTVDQINTRSLTPRNPHRHGQRGGERVRRQLRPDSDDAAGRTATKNFVTDA